MKNILLGLRPCYINRHGSGQGSGTYCLVCSYEIVLKNKDTKGQLMSLQQTLRQEIHAKIAAQTAEESAKRKVGYCCH